MICQFSTRKISCQEYNKKYKKNIIYSFIGENRGLYFLYNKYEELLYIGYARNLDLRLTEHLFGKTNTKNFQKEIDHFKLLGEENFDLFREKYIDCLDIEFYLINKLNPKYNIRKGLYNAYC